MYRIGASLKVIRCDNINNQAVILQSKYTIITPLKKNALLMQFFAGIFIPSYFRCQNCGELKYEKRPLLMTDQFQNDVMANIHTDILCQVASDGRGPSAHDGGTTRPAST